MSSGEVKYLRIAGAVGKGDFIVSATVDGAMSDGMALTPDKTVAEIIEAHNAGQSVCFSLTTVPADGVTLEQTLPLIDFIESEDASVLDFGGTAIGVAVSVQMTHDNNADVDISNLYVFELSDELPTGATEGQVLTADADGKPVWADASGGGAFVVNGTLGDDGTTVTIDKTYAEILEAYNNNKIPSMGLILPDGHMVLPLYVYATDGGVFVFQSLANDGMLLSATVIVSADSVEFSDDIVKTGDTLPTGGTAGQVLTIGSDGSPVWADPVATSAEGVEFG